MRKLVVSSFMCLLFVISGTLMAQDTKKECCCKKEHKECSKDCKSCKKEKEKESSDKKKECNNSSCKR